MGQIRDAFARIYRQYKVDGLPGSGAHQPAKSEIRALGHLIETVTGASGVSAYAAAVANGFAGTEEEWLNRPVEVAEAAAAVALAAAAQADALRNVLGQWVPPGATMNMGTPINLLLAGE